MRRSLRSSFCDARSQIPPPLRATESKPAQQCGGTIQAPSGMETQRFCWEVVSSATCATAAAKTTTDKVSWDGTALFVSD
ncbi:hypothetical protein GN956_G18175 [Arapaima gigas]